MKIFLNEQPKKYQISNQRMKTKTSNTHIFELRMKDWNSEIPPYVRTTVVNPDGSQLECRKNSEIIHPFWSNTTYAKNHAENSSYNVEWIEAKIKPLASKGMNSFSAFFDGLVPSFCSYRGECCLLFEVSDGEGFVSTLLSDPFVVASKKQKDLNPIWQSAILDYQKNTDKKIDIEKYLYSFPHVSNLTRTSNQTVTNNNGNAIVMHPPKSKGRGDLTSHPSFAAPIFAESPKSGPSTSPTSSVSPMSVTATSGEHNKLLTSLSNRNLVLQDSSNQLQQQNQLLVQNNLFLAQQNESLMLKLVQQTQQQIEIADNSINTLVHLEMQYKTIMQQIAGIFNSEKDEMEVNHYMKIDDD